MSITKSPDGRDCLEFTSGGFELYVPPTPFSESGDPAFKAGEIPHVVMVDDKKSIFYDVDYHSPDLLNTTSWKDLRLYEVPQPAIVFPPAQWDKHEKDNTQKITGFLVSVESTEGEITSTATKIGAVHVQAFPQGLMNWSVLESLKGEEIVAEMKAGLLRHVFNRRRRADDGFSSYVNSNEVLSNMSRPWHRNGDALNWELDKRFVGAVEIDKGHNWRLHATMAAVE